MVTNVARAYWSGDVVIAAAERLGLVIPSKVRTAKISTVEAHAATMIGRVDASTWRKVIAVVGEAMQSA